MKYFKNVRNNASKMRSSLTKSEQHFLNAISMIPNLNIEIQKVIECYGCIFIVDFYLKNYNLAIEIDGEYHWSLEQQKKDKKRTEELSRVNISVERFTNKQVDKLTTSELKNKIIEMLQHHIFL